MLEHMFPFRKLILTDIEEQPAAHDSDSEETQRLYRDKRRITKVLCDLGALGPFFQISGFQGRKFKTIDQLGHPLALAFWGSPHWGVVNDGASTSFRDSAQFKTNAFESLSWMCPQAFIAMTFSEKYGAEFWSPKYNQTRQEDCRCSRELRIVEGFFREYAPIGSGTSFRRLSETTKTMVAMLIPYRFRDAVTYRGEQCDLGVTMYRVLQRISQGPEYAVEVGGQTFELGYELYLAKQELDTNNSQWPPPQA